MTTVSAGDWLEAIFAAVDGKNVAGFTAFLHPDVRFRFGNMPVVEGLNAVSEFVGGFFASVEAAQHRIDAHWPIDGGIVCHGWVTYTRLDGSSLTVPFSNIFLFNGEAVGTYLIFADLSGL